MKSKPHSHRSTNTFKFQGFHAKLKDIKISARKYLVQKLESDYESETLLLQTIRKWAELNRTQIFQDFQAELGQDIQTIGQVLLNRNHIVNVFKSFLSSSDSLVYAPLLQCLVGFARDIPDIFYAEHFNMFFPILINIASSHTRCHDTMENVFVAIVSLFTLLRKYLEKDFDSSLEKQDFNSIYKFYVKTGFCSLLCKKYPWYVNELAAESFGTLLRNFSSNIKKEVLSICLNRLHGNSSEIEGVGRVIFNMLKLDVSRRLHSSCASTFSLFLDLVVHNEVTKDLSTQSGVFCLHQLAFYVTESNPNIGNNWLISWKQDADKIWVPLLHKCLEVIESYTESCDSLTSILKFVRELVQFRNTVLVTDYYKLVDVLCEALKLPLSNDAANIVGEIGAMLFLCPNCEQYSNSLLKYLSAFFESFCSPTVKFGFVDSVINSVLFEEFILDIYLKYTIAILSSEKNEISLSLLENLSNVVISKTSPIRTAVDLDNYSHFPLKCRDVEDTVSVQSHISELLESILYKGLLQDLENVEILIQCCLILPHVETLDKKVFTPLLTSVMDNALKLIEKGSTTLLNDMKEPKRKKRKVSSFNFNVNPVSTEISRKSLFLVSVIVETLHHILPNEDFLSLFPGNILVNVLKDCEGYRSNIHLLKAIDIYLTALQINDESKLNYENLLDIYQTLGPCLSSHRPLVRHLVAHILSLFSFPVVNAEEQQNVFKIMYEVESSMLSPLDFRERLRLLSKLGPEKLCFGTVDLKPFETAPLLFIIGQLFINFKEIWPTAKELIAKWAQHLDEELFWSIWFPQVQLASHFAMRTLCKEDIEYETATHFEASSIRDLHSSLIKHPGYSHFNEEPSYINFRDLMWQCMQEFSTICERRNADVVSAFFDFLHYELFPADYDVAPSQDISLRAEESLEDKETGLSVKNKQEQKDISLDKRVKKAPTKSLCEHLALLAKFRNPKVVYKSKQLEDIYCEFLSHSHGKAQKLALDALLSFNYKFLTSYRESLYNIINAKSFRSEITLFDLEGNSEDNPKSLKIEHRTQFMPYLMRIMYSKMLTRTTRGTGKLNCASRRSIVLRFLAGSKETELDTFLDLTFDFILHHINGSVLEVVTRVSENIDLTKVVPLRRLQGVLGTLDSILSRLNFMIKEKRVFLLKVILFSLSLSEYLLENKKEEISSYNCSLLKSIRQVAMLRLIQFFNIFEDYKWTDDDVEAVFSAAVWPVLKRLPDEGIYSPTPLLKLFICWSKNKLFHILLARHLPQDQTFTPFTFIIKLINHPKCSKDVVNTVYNMIEHLLGKISTNEEDLDEHIQEEPVVMPLKNVLPLEEHAKKHNLENLSVGESLVFFSMNGILDNINKSLQGLTSKQVIKKLDLSILTHLAEWITNNKDAQQILSTIVPILRKYCAKKQDQATSLLKICSHLLKVTPTKKYYKDFLSMFSLYNERAARLSLCEVVAVVFKGTNKEGTIGKWCALLNAWKSDSVDEIDSETRMKCFWEIKAHLAKAETFDEELVVFLLRQNLWSINNCIDQSLRTLSVLCMENLFEFLNRVDTRGRMKVILDFDMFPLIKQGLKNDNEGIRDSILVVLGHSVQNCSGFHPSLQDLAVLSDAKDLECDFFSNMSHLQRSRRARTLYKFSESLNENKYSLQIDNLIDYILPITSVYLFRDEYMSDSYLIDGAINCIGSIAKKLPWQSYQTLLKFYLDVLLRNTNHLRLAVRVLEAVIDAFHEEIGEVEDSNLISDFRSLKKFSDDGFDLSQDAIRENDSEDTSISRDKRSQKSRDIYFSLTRFFIPQIEKALAKKSARDSEHKVNKKKFPEDEDIKRIPLAFALVKLLKKFPPKLLRLKVSGILMKLIFYLKSKAESIRKEARNMLVKVMEELGGSYFPYLVKDMNSILDKGFQTHILIYTLHSIIIKLQKGLQPQNISPCLNELMNICLEDLFGSKAEEKGVTKLTGKFKEMRSDKGYSIVGIIAQNINVEDVTSMMVLFKEKLLTHDEKVVNKIITCLQKISNGLERNINITVEHKSMLVYGILTDKIKDLTAKKRDGTVKKDVVAKPDCFLIEPEPRKVGTVPKTDEKTTSHALVEFALNLLFNLLRKEHFDVSNKQHIDLLNPYVSLIADCLLSEYPETGIQALHVFGCLVRYPLSSLRENIDKICVQMFLILDKFASSSLCKGKIFELVQLTFKIIAQLIKELDWYQLQTDQYKILIYYARNNLEDYNLHHSSFTVLNALIVRKVNVEELHKLLSAVQELSVMSTNMNMLDQARSTFYKYIMSYSKKKKQYKEVLLYFLWNISYEDPIGRMSAALMLNDLITKMDKTIFDQNLEVTIWYKLSSQLIVEKELEHRILLRKILKVFFRRSSRKKLLVDKCVELMNDDSSKSTQENSISIHIGAKSLLSMVESEYEELRDTIFNTILPRIALLLHPGRFSSLEGECDIETLDFSLCSLLELLQSLMDIYLTSKRDMFLSSLADDVWEFVQSHLLYPNLQVRLTSSSIFGRLFSAFPTENGNIPSIISNTKQAHNVIVDFCEQLNTECPVGSAQLVQLGLAVVRNLIYIVRQSHKVKFRDLDLIEKDDKSECKQLKSVSNIRENIIDESFLTISEGAMWVLRRVGSMAYIELKENARESTFKRECFLNLIAGLVVVLGERISSSKSLVSFIIHHLTRELSDKRLPLQLSQRTQEVANLVRDKIGQQLYTEEVMKTQGSLEKKRAKRKAKARRLIVSNPQLAVKKKANKNLAKKVSKKRKRTELKLKPSKRKLKNLVFVH